MICRCGTHIPAARHALGLTTCVACGEVQARTEAARKQRSVAETHKGGFVYLGTNEQAARQYAEDIAGMRAGTCGRTGGDMAYVPGKRVARKAEGVTPAADTNDFLGKLAAHTISRLNERRFPSRDAEAEFCRTTFATALLAAQLIGADALAARLDHYHKLVVKHGRVGITMLQRDLP